MNKYHVEIKYETLEIEINADSEDEARDIALDNEEAYITNTRVKLIKKNIKNEDEGVC